MKLSEDGYVMDLSLEEAIKIFDDLYLTLNGARGCGKTRMIYNYTTAWLKIRKHLEEKTK